MPPARRAPAYFQASRSLSVSYVFILPLLALYQVGVLFDGSARNGAEPLLLEPFLRFGPWGVFVLNLLLLSLLCFAIARSGDVRRRRPGLYAVMFLEAGAWGSLLLIGAVFVPELLAVLPPALRDVVASAGAGVYEEAVFRLVLFGGLVVVMHRLLGTPLVFALPVALGVSALLFSYAHHAIGGEPWDPGVFWFRAAMGAALGVLFWVRGLGIAVYTHALYNVLVVLGHHV